MTSLSDTQRVKYHIQDTWIVHEGKQFYLDYLLFLDSGYLRFVSPEAQSDGKRLIYKRVMIISFIIFH